MIDRGQRVVAYDSEADTVAEIAAHGAEGTASLKELVARLDPPRAVWLMVPSGDATNETIDALGDLLSSGDTLIDGGNSHYRNAQRWSTSLRERGIDLIDGGERRRGRDDPGGGGDGGPDRCRFERTRWFRRAAARIGEPTCRPSRDLPGGRRSAQSPRSLVRQRRVLVAVLVAAVPNPGDAYGLGPTGLKIDLIGVTHRWSG